MQRVLLMYAQECKKHAPHFTDKNGNVGNREHFLVKLNGVGIHHGKGVIIDKLGRLHGDTYNRAYKIGEDLCEGGSVMISKETMAVCQAEADFNNARYQKLDFKPENSHDVDPNVYTVSGNVNNLECELVDVTDDRFLHPSLLQLVSRHNPQITKVRLDGLDKLLKHTYLRKFTVLMYEFELEEIEKEFGAQAGTALKYNGLKVVRPVIARFNGIELEDSLWIFEHSIQALGAALSMRRALKKYNMKFMR